MNIVEGCTFLREDGSQYSLYVSELGVYKAQRKVDGRRVKKSLGKDLAKAIPLLHEFHRPDKSEVLLGDKTVKCLVAHKEMIDRGWGPKKQLAESTKILYSGLFKNYCKRIHNKRVVDVTPQNILDILDDAQDAGLEWGGSTLRNLYVTLDAFFEKQTMTPASRRVDNPVRRIGKENVPPTPTPQEIDDDVVISPTEAKAIAANFLAPAPPTTGRGGHRRFTQSLWVATVMRMIFLLLLESGMRVSEVLALTLDDVKYRRNTGLHAVGELPRSIHITKQRARSYKPSDPDTVPFAPLKGTVGKIEGQARMAPLSTKFAAALAAYIEQGLASGHLREGGFLFPNTRQKMFSPSQVRKNLLDAAKRAGVTRRITTHHTRHTYVSWKVEEGMDISKIGSYSGQTERTIVTRYAHRDEESAAHEEVRETSMLEGIL